MRIINKSIVVVLLLVFLNNLLYAGWGGLKYAEYATHISDQLYVLYIKHGICTDPKRDCRQKNIFFISQAEPKISFYIYQVGNLQMVDEIIEILMNEYQLAQKNGDKDLIIHLSIFKLSHDELNKIGFWDGIFNDYEFVNLTIKGDKK